MNYHLYIPTRGRTDSQLTVERLPAFMHRHVTLVCPKSEHKKLRSNYPTVGVMVQPDEIQSLHKKREWLMDHVSDKERSKHAFMLDDDLYFYVFNGEKHVVAGTDKEATKKFWRETLPDLCDNLSLIHI